MSDIALDAGERFAKVGELDICFQTFGRPSDPPLLLIAGLGAQMILCEDDFCAALAERGLWVVRYDNRDVGKSSQIDWKPSATPARRSPNASGATVPRPICSRTWRPTRSG